MRLYSIAFGIKMFIQKVVFVYFVTQFCFIFVFTQYRYDCTEDFCSKHYPACPESKCENGSRLIKNATKCGCCHVCIKQLGEGEKCRTQEVAAIPTQECGPGLQCDKSAFICVPADTKCVKDRIQYDKNIKNGFLRNNKGRPDCDEFGFFKPVVCISDTLCYCVNKEGERLFGTEVARRKKDMNCRCSRDYDEFPRRDRPIRSGDFLRCISNGNYDPLQCTEKWCYCMGDSFHIVGTKITANTTIKDLLCYNKQRHKDDDALLRSKCWRERNILQKQIKNYENEGITVIGVDLPECDLDGSYAPVQCTKNSCYCVKRNGDMYGGLNKIKRSLKNILTCQCTREKEILSGYVNEMNVKNFLQNNPCDLYGNY